MSTVRDWSRALDPKVIAASMELYNVSDSSSRKLESGVTPRVQGQRIPASTAQHGKNPIAAGFGYPARIQREAAVYVESRIRKRDEVRVVGFRRSQRLPAQLVAVVYTLVSRSIEIYIERTARTDDRRQHGMR